MIREIRLDYRNINLEVGEFLDRRQLHWKGEVQNKLLTLHTEGLCGTIYSITSTVSKKSLEVKPGIVSRHR